MAPFHDYIRHVIFARFQSARIVVVNNYFSKYKVYFTLGFIYCIWYSKMELPCVSNITLGVLSQHEIQTLSVCEISEQGLEGQNTIHDERLGFSFKDSTHTCVTCNQSYQKCPGHFGHYALCKPLVHPLYYKRVIYYLEHTCHKCFRYSKTRKCTRCSHYRSCEISYDTESHDVMFDRKKVDPDKIYDLLTKIDKRELIRFGAKKTMLPANYIMFSLIIPPSCIRPRVSSQSYDTLSIALNNIILCDKRLRNARKNKSKFARIYNSLKKMIYHYFMCIKDRINSKKGQVRNNIMGKRVNYSARSVIGPDSCLPSGYVGVPKMIAEHMTTQEYVTPYNKHLIIKKRKENKIKYVERNGVKHNTVDVERIFVGDIVHRTLQNDDIVFLNRQPSLHKHSMMAKKIKILPFKTIRFNLESTKGFNADFDGDEMNLYVPQTIESKVELLELSQNKQNYISFNNSKPILVPVQDALIGLYIMTKDTSHVIKRMFFFDILSSLDLHNFDYSKKEKHIQNVLRKHHIGFTHNGSVLLSFIFPNTFMFQTDDVVIERGVLIKGIITKNILYSSERSIMKILIREYDSDYMRNFLSNIQFVTNQWLTYSGYSIGLDDCMLMTQTADYQEKLKARIRDTIANADGKAIDVLSELDMNSFYEQSCDTSRVVDNNIYKAIASGSKGSMFNLYQINCSLGQQMVLNRKIPYQYNNGTRSSIYEPLQKESESLESKGFIKNSFSSGLSPQEFIFHAMAGREGICNVSTNTSKSGYIYRCLVKLCEDICVKHDCTVRNSDNDIIQFLYGNHNFDPTHMIEKNKSKTTQFIDVNRVVHLLNEEHESNQNAL